MLHFDIILYVKLITLGVLVERFYQQVSLYVKFLFTPLRHYPFAYNLLRIYFLAIAWQLVRLEATDN